MVAMPEGGFEGRCQFIENHLPVWMRVDIKVSEGRIQYPNGSIIQALAGGADKPRSHTPSLYVADEFAHQDDQEGVWTAVAPLIQKGAKLIFISTPNGATNQFATLFHGYKVGG
jgi:phage FluMu gp28-like protein